MVLKNNVNTLIFDVSSIRPFMFKYYKSIRIESGDTLTSVAHTYADQVHYENHHKYIQEVVYMNHLEDADDIREGTYLIIPYYSNELLK